MTLSRKGRTPLALCPGCTAPLISTLDFPKYEFYCLECGCRCGFLDPQPGEPSPELDARYEALKAEWDAHVGGRLLLHGGWLHDCRLCGPRQEPHRGHATPDEWEAHEKAMEWLKGRVSAHA